MCVTCGCGSSQEHNHHDHEHDHHHHSHDVINLEAEILAENNKYASSNHKFFQDRKSLALNFVSSPGSGKTSLLEETIKAMPNDRIYVVEGDQHTELDAARIRSAGASAYQIQTGKACHLDGHMVSHALEHLDIVDNSFVFIENVGNLICPALFDLGEHAKVVLISITEGEDKPLKYPDMFFGADIVLITKIDLLPHLKFDLSQCIANIQKINPKAKILQLSSSSKDGFAEWLNWLYKAKDFLSL